MKLIKKFLADNYKKNSMVFDTHNITALNFSHCKNSMVIFFSGSEPL